MGCNIGFKWVETHFLPTFGPISGNGHKEQFYTQFTDSVSTPYASKTNGTTRPQLTHHGRESREKPIRKFSIDPASSIRTSIADPVFADPASETPVIGFGKRGLLERGLFRKDHFLEIPEHLEILENPQVVENKSESDH